MYYLLFFNSTCFSNFTSSTSHTTHHKLQLQILVSVTIQSPDHSFNNYQSISSFSSSQDTNVARRNLHEGVLNKDQEDEMFVYGYRKSKIRSFLCYLSVFLTLGILRLVMHWWSHWLLLATHKQCSLEEAEKVLIKEKFQGKHTIYYVKTVVTLSSDAIR
jgi:hypothetical protein